MTTTRQGVASAPCPDALADLQKEFEIWRASRSGRSRIPESLWQAAVAMSQIYGLSQTARILGVNRTRLKKKQAALAGTLDVAEFVEVDMSEFGQGATGSDKTVVEIRRRGGDVTMRIEMGPASHRFLLPLVSALWGPE